MQAAHPDRGAACPFFESAASLGTCACGALVYSQMFRERHALEQLASEKRRAFENLRWTVVLPACVEPVRSALAAVKGVSHATVTLEGHEARVQYDPTQSSVADLVAAVERASNPALAMSFKATMKR